jgi:6-phosphogluconolactonase/glucosamine-6-phosphate isomerase/deaminase
MADILKSKRVLLLANGLAKAKVIDRLRKPAVTSRFPASFLWLHPVATVICDRAALSA